MEPPSTIQSPAAPSGSEGWFRHEVHPQAARLRSYLKGSYPRLDDVDDVVQESFARVWQARAQAPIVSAKAFLFRIARNLAIDAIRRKRASPVETVPDLAGLRATDPAADAGDALGSKEKLAALAASIDALPSRCREIILLTKIEGRSYRETAELLGISEKTVAEQVWRGAKRLAEELAARGVTSFDR